jgi:hypothetical protein
MARQGAFTSLALCFVLSSSCSTGPVDLGFWLEPLSFQSVRIGAPISPEEFVRIEQVARAEISGAFKDFAVTVSSSRRARFKVQVVPSIADMRLLRPGVFAGESRSVSWLGGSGSVNFEFVANGAMVFAPDDAGRAVVIDSIGRGIGRVAIHEFLHQLLPKRPLHDAKDPGSYEGNSAARIEGYYGDLHWDIARPWLEARLKRPEAVTR